ncbi:MAG: hypothetical protein L6R37_001353 [Teloschistes peruensis]|nr:MAG: hypothetical protein L6R37_001353 [Teloschistes peruensis]
MSSLFYNRYVPPTASKVPLPVKDELEDPRQSKKRRKQSDANTTNVNAIKNSSQSTSGHSGKDRPSILPKAERKAERKARKNNSDPNQVVHGGPGSTIHESTAQAEAPSELVGKKKTSKKLKWTREVLKPGTITITDDVESSKHSKILSKYERSVKAPTNPAEITNDGDEPQNGNIPPPETHGLVPIPQPPQVPDAAPPSAFSALPNWLREPIRVSEAETLSFDQLQLSSSIIATLKSKGYKEAFAIQAAVLPLLLSGHNQHDGDLCVAASTGSGKTLAYALPMLEALHDMPITRLRGLVVVPTRELVSQARKTFETCSLGTDLKIGTASGSKPLKEEQEALITCHQQYNPEAYQREQEQKKALDEDEQLLNWDNDDDLEKQPTSRPKLTGYVSNHISKVDVLICTPGRLIEHIRHTRGFNLDHVQWLVIDEADRLLDEDSQQWVEIVIPALEHQKPLTDLENERLKMFHLLRKRDVRKVILCATMTRDVGKLQELKLRRLKLVMLENKPGRGGDEPEAGSIEPEVDSGGQVELPSKLRENAVQIKDVQNKPLYLIELLKDLSILQPNGTGPRPQEPKNGTSDSDTDETSDDDSSTTSDETSSNSSSSDATTSTSSHSLEHSNPPPSNSSPQQKRPTCLIFTHSTESAHRLSRLLSLLSPHLASATATLTKSSSTNNKNKTLLPRLQSGSLTALISTDRASRGLDILDLAHVINYDMPPSVDSYVHRVGRTARAGKEGTATTLVGWTEGRWFWNEIARGGRIRRGGKVARVKVKEEGWGEEELEAYAEALKKVGEEARGEGR